MIHEILKHISPELGNLSGYITVRAACALAFAFVMSLLIGPGCVRRLAQLKFGQQVRNFKTEETKQFNIHQHKAGTPTMGGLIIIFSTLAAVVLFCSPLSTYVWIVVGVMLGTGALGFMDDYLKIVKRNHKGVSARGKLVVQIVIGLAVGWVLWVDGASTTYVIRTTVDGIATTNVVRGNAHLLVPFFKEVYPYLGFFIVLWAALVLTATSNAVNLTDGLDGLAIGTTITVALPYLVITYLVSRVDYSGYLYVPHVPQAGELGVLLAALLGASLGFLWFNAHPAEIFMGDTGSLALGGVIGTIALLCKHEILLVFIGGIFVIEEISVAIQVAVYKWKGKRVFLMSPLHNHFVKLGMPESKIIARFLIVSLLLALAGLSTMKLR
jgi:phospho-N-acetylmuramoyl-pentapeptide-transferase